MAFVKDFENIGGPWTAANEPGRLRRALSKRVFPKPPTPAETGTVSRVQDILNRCQITPDVTPVVKNNPPHIHLDVYESDYKRIHGDEIAKQMMEKNAQGLARIPVVAHAAPKWQPTEDNYNHPSIQMLQMEYYNKGITPPIDARLKAHKAAGYPQSYLLKMLKKHEERMERQPEVEAWFDLMMGPHLKKKETVSKPRTLTQIFKIKPFKPIKPDDDGMAIVADEDDEE
jgi:hypothetical protein